MVLVYSWLWVSQVSEAKRLSNAAVLGLKIIINFYFDILHGRGTTGDQFLCLDRTGQVMGHTPALLAHHGRLKLLVKGGVVGSHCAHQGVYDEPRLKRSAGKAGKGIVGLQKAIPQVADLCLKSFKVIGLHEYSILYTWKKAT